MTLTLTKAEISDGLITSLKLDKRDAKELTENLFEIVRHTLEEGEGVKITGFGNFELRDKSARPGRNPRTGEEAVIQKRRVVTFRSGQKLRRRIERSESE